MKWAAVPWVWAALAGAVVVYLLTRDRMPGFVGDKKQILSSPGAGATLSYGDFSGKFLW